MIAQQKMQAMCVLQDKMNAKVDPDWVATGNAFLRAAAVELGELLDHAGFKWWRAQEADIEQVRMELVDVWHFLLSSLVLSADGDTTVAANRAVATIETGHFHFDGRDYDLSEMTPMDKADKLMGLCCARRVDLQVFGALIKDYGLDWDALYTQYVSKIQLNFFRQDHGYKTGDYIKHWDGREDNVHLVEIMAGLDANADDFPNQIYNGLKQRYTALCETA